MTTDDAHWHWVDAGHCSAIDWTRAWCNGRPGHEGPHWAPYLLPDGTQRTVTW